MDIEKIAKEFPLLSEMIEDDPEIIDIDSYKTIKKSVIGSITNINLKSNLLFIHFTSKESKYYFMKFTQISFSSSENPICKDLPWILTKFLIYINAPSMLILELPSIPFEQKMNIFYKFLLDRNMYKLFSLQEKP